MHETNLICFQDPSQAITKKTKKKKKKGPPIWKLISCQNSSTSGEFSDGKIEIKVKKRLFNSPVSSTSTHTNVYA